MTVYTTIEIITVDEAKSTDPVPLTKACQEFVKSKTAERMSIYTEKVIERREQAYLKRAQQQRQVDDFLQNHPAFVLEQQMKDIVALKLAKAEAKSLIYSEISEFDNEQGLVIAQANNAAQDRMHDSGVEQLRRLNQLEQQLKVEKQLAKEEKKRRKEEQLRRSALRKAESEN